jgi:hypothetical protein
LVDIPPRSETGEMPGRLEAVPQVGIQGNIGGCQNGFRGLFASVPEAPRGDNRTIGKVF